MGRDQPNNSPSSDIWEGRTPGLPLTVPDSSAEEYTRVTEKSQLHPEFHITGQIIPLEENPLAGEKFPVKSSSSSQPRHG